MRITVFLNGLGLGGTEKAACFWAKGLQERGHDVMVMALEQGPRGKELEDAGIPISLAVPEADSIAKVLRKFSPDVIHAHAPGYPHQGDVLGEALALLRKIPVVQTNIFGRLDNPKEEAWTDFRLFISWTSCVQAAQRSFRPLEEAFFRKASVASYPIVPLDQPSQSMVEAFRKSHHVANDEVLLGRLSRPEPNKWTDLAVESFRLAGRQNPKIKLLLREPPEVVRRALEVSPDRDRFVILPVTDAENELALTIASLDIVLHTSVIGESFGYGIAEPMNHGKPVIANSTPWQDQAQIELVRHGETGFIASTPATMARSILTLAGSAALRNQMGQNGQKHIRLLANFEQSVARLEKALELAISGSDNPDAAEDAVRSRTTAKYLRGHQFGHSWQEQIKLRPFYYRVRFNQARKSWLAASHRSVPSKAQSQ